ncbi:MAG: hypothetical protein ACFFE2_13240 [Candidatus Thorarchaeota archaeon]
MSFGKFATISLVSVIAFSMMFLCSSSHYATVIDTPTQYETAAETNIISNAGFETGEFSPWVNEGGTSYNEIVSDRVYAGSHALYMDSHVSSVPYEPVDQLISTTVGIDQSRYFSAAVYPTKVGNTAGRAGVDQFTVFITDTVAETTKLILYLWSGYTYPGGDLNVNVTTVMYLLFDLVPNQWNLVERDLLNDYIAFYGTPADASDLVVTQISVLSHISNGDPGDCWIDDVKISYTDEAVTTNETTTTTTDETQTPPPETPPGDSNSLITLLIAGGSGGVIIIVVIVIFLTRKGSSSAAPPSEYQW